MPSGRISRRTLLGAAGAAVAASALPVLPGASRLLPQAAAADMQTNLSNLVNMRFGMFNHFNMGTFTNEEWASPNQDPTRFAPTAVNCDQWAAAAVAAQMKYGVLTTKHHDGFCLWPTAYNKYNVAYSSYKQDIVKQYVDAFRARNLKVGLYFSIWDRTRPVQAYGGHVTDTTQAIQPGDLTYILGQITELLTNYGTIDMFITDGYAWQMGQQAVPYQRIREHVKSLQPDIVMIDHGGLSVPFLGDAIYFEEPLGITSPTGNTYASLQGQTISNGWFWHPSTPTESLLSQQSILSHLGDLEPKYTSFILNCPPNRNGVLDNNIVQRLTDVGNAWGGPNSGRAPLPTQMLRVEHPVTPVAAYATAFHTGEGPMNAIDGFSDKGVETCWSTWSLSLPQSITIDLGGVWSNISSLEYLPKQWNRSNSTDGDITACTISTSTDGVTFTQAATASWTGDRTTKIVEWPARNAAFVRIQVTAATGGYANIGNLRIGGRTATPAQVSPLFPGDGTVYRLVARHSGKAADVSGGKTANNTPVIQWPWQNHSNQKWTIVAADNGYYKIRNVNSGTLMEIGGLSRANGGTADIWSDATAPQQHWAITPTGDGYYLLTNRFSGLSLNVDSGSTADGAAVNQWSYTSLAQQQWQIIPS
ncbi:RICIN domain-containing protein [Streptomyces griseorubiginosus]|uniref:alpha-L-fucosidase n=1 Tax=Streptomyces griseorubiginosus TaxID=67304 RepID=A0AAI8L7C9_9ACTN|nr:alpha-L-fucosidase [Streptomyces griseorubiginosus]AYC42945.1 O-GlcNAcase NagJ [Streptomyces griseorubiginosus]